MKKARLISILISNMFMLHFIIPLFKLLRLNNLIGVLVKQANINIEHVTNQLGGNNNE